MEKVSNHHKRTRCTRAIKDQSVLNLARENGIHIPALCYHPEVISSGGSCRVCLVEAHQGGTHEDRHLLQLSRCGKGWRSRPIRIS